MNCQAIIKVGNNKGNNCNRVNCTIKGHDKYVKGKGKCRHIILYGKNRDFICGRIKCQLHRNLADYLDLQIQFRNRLITNDTYDIFTKSLEVCYIISSENYNDVIPVIKDILVHFDNIRVDRDRELLIIYIFKMLDTNVGVLLRKNKKFNKIVNEKIIEIKNCNSTSDEMKKYLNTIEIGKTFICKKKNFLLKLKIHMLFRSYLLKLYKITKEKQRIKENKRKLIFSLLINTHCSGCGRYYYVCFWGYGGKYCSKNCWKRYDNPDDSAYEDNHILDWIYDQYLDLRYSWDDLGSYAKRWRKIREDQNKMIENAKKYVEYTNNKEKIYIDKESNKILFEPPNHGYTGIDGFLVLENGKYVKL